MEQLPGYCGKGCRASLLDNGVGAVPVQWETCQSGGGDNYLKLSFTVRQFSLKVFRVRGALCLIERYEFRSAELNEMLVHCLHAVFVASLFDILLDLVEVIVPDARLDGGSCIHHFKDRKNCFAAFSLLPASER